MALSTQDLAAILGIFTQHKDWDELSELINYDAKALRTRVYEELFTTIKYDLDSY